MKKSFYPLCLASLVSIFISLPSPAGAEKPHLGEIGRCAVSFDNSMDQEKMVFTCSIYVKMSAVAERKAMERCEQMKSARGIKAPCKVIAE